MEVKKIRFKTTFPLRLFGQVPGLRLVGQIDRSQFDAFRWAGGESRPLQINSVRHRPVCPANRNFENYIVSRFQTGATRVDFESKIDLIQHRGLS